MPPSIVALIPSIPNGFHYSTAVSHVPVVFHIALSEKFPCEEFRRADLYLHILKGTLLNGALKQPKLELILPQSLTHF